MTRSGRPLRFLATVITGWVALRVAMLWPQTAAPQAIADSPEPPRLTEFAANAPPTLPPSGRSAAVEPRRRPEPGLALRAPPIAEAAGQAAMAVATPGEAERNRRGDVGVAPSPASPLLPRPLAFPLAASRWSASAWLVARPGSHASAGFEGGQLGASQAGLRISYSIDGSRRIAAFGRVSTPLSGRGREAAVGLEWRPTTAPVRLVIEERVPLDGGPAAPAAGVVGGFGPRPVGGGVRVEGYGEAGAIRRHRLAGFVDGAVRASRPITRIGGADVDIGGGIWGGAQPGAARLDIGPSLGAAVRLGARSVRMTLDWRQRVAGAARPGSGLALTLGADL